MEPTPNKVSVVTVKWKDVPPVEIELNPDALTWDHLMQFTDIESKAKTGELSERETLEAMAEILTAITGMDIRKTSARVVNELLKQLKALSSVDDDIKN